MRRRRTVYNSFKIPSYRGNPIVNMNYLYGVDKTSWTALDNRYCFEKNNPNQDDIIGYKNGMLFDGGSRGLTTNIRPEDSISTEMTIEVSMSDFTVVNHDAGICFALRKGYATNANMYANCRGMRDASGIMCSYWSVSQDRPVPEVKSFTGMKTIAITSGSICNTRIAYYIDGLLVPSSLSESPRSRLYVHSLLNIGGTSHASSGFGPGLKAIIHAVRFHYGIVPQEDLYFNHIIDRKLFS